MQRKPYPLTLLFQTNLDSFVHTRLHCLHGVGQQVNQHLLQSERIAQHMDPRQPCRPNDFNTLLAQAPIHDRHGSILNGLQ